MFIQSSTIDYAQRSKTKYFSDSVARVEVTITSFSTKETDRKVTKKIVDYIYGKSSKDPSKDIDVLAYFALHPSKRTLKLKASKFRALTATEQANVKQRICDLSAYITAVKLIK